MGAKLGRVDFITDGTIVNYMKADSAEMHLTTSIDFFFNDNAMKEMNKTIQESTSLDFFDPSGDEAYQDAIYNILGPKDYQKYRDDQTALGQVKRLPEKLRVQFLFSDISFAWDKETSAFVSNYTSVNYLWSTTGVQRDSGIIVIEKEAPEIGCISILSLIKFSSSSLKIIICMDFHRKNLSMRQLVKQKQNIVYSLPKRIALISYRLGNRSQQRRFLKKFYTPLIEEVSTDENE